MGSNVILYPFVYRWSCLCFSMAVVIRLQGLSGTAGSGDIRRFFTGLKIPDGGVHIIGGKRDEAFIIFASDEDARRAMTRSGGLIKNSPITLLLSSKAEMQKLLERTAAENMELEPKRGFEDRGRQTQRCVYPEVGTGSSSQSGYIPDSQHESSSTTEGFFGVFLKGLPYSVTEEQIREFFYGLSLEEVLLLRHPSGRLNGMGFAKFLTREDAVQALKRDRQYIGTRFIEVKRTYAHNWHNAVEQMRMFTDKVEDTINIEGTNRMENTNKVDYFEQWRAPGCNRTNPQRDRSRSPVYQRDNAPSDGEYCVMLENLSFSADIGHIKELFPFVKLDNDQILFLTDSCGRRTRSAFVLFRSLRDLCEALSSETRRLWHRNTSARPISREDMIKLLDSGNQNVRAAGNFERFENQERPPAPPMDRYDSERSCVFVRNLPFDVRKDEITRFFQEFNVTEDRVQLLHDHSGAKVGQALVVFGSEAEAMEVLCLNGHSFFGSKIMMNCITRSQMKQLADETLQVREPLPREDHYSGRSSNPFYTAGNTSYPNSGLPRDGNMLMTNMRDRFHGGSDNEPRSMRSCSPRYRGNGVHDRHGSPAQPFDSPTCVQMINLPFTIKCEEIYDFCHGFRVIPGSVQIQYEPTGEPKGSATLLFESYEEAVTAIQELCGRPIGPRKIDLFLA